MEFRMLRSGYLSLDLLKLRNTQYMLTMPEYQTWVMGFRVVLQGKK